MSTPLSSVKMGTQLRHLVLQNMTALRQAFRAADPKGTGYMSESQFRAAIYHTVGVPLGMIDIKNSTSYSVQSGRVEYERWLRSFLSTIHQDSYHEAADSTLFDHMHKLVISNFAVVISTMKECDYGADGLKTGFIDLEAFKQVLMNEAGVSIEEMNLLLRKIPSHNYGTVQYEAFIKKFIEDPYNGAHSFNLYFRPEGSRIEPFIHEHRNMLEHEAFARAQEAEMQAAVAYEAEMEHQSFIAHSQAAEAEARAMANAAAHQAGADAAAEAEFFNAQAAQAAEADYFALEVRRNEEAAFAADMAARHAVPHPLPVPQSAVRRQLAQEQHQINSRKASAAAEAQAIAATSYIPRSPDLPHPTLHLNPRDHLESVSRFLPRPQYVESLDALERDGLLEIEREAKYLNDAARKQLADAAAGLAESKPPTYGVHPGTAAETQQPQQQAQTGDVLSRIYQEKPELYSRLYTGLPGGPRIVGGDMAVMFRDKFKSTDMASKLDILRNTPMDPIRKIEILQELRGANNLGCDVGDSLASATKREMERGYGAAGARIGCDKNTEVQPRHPASAPEISVLSGNRTSGFIVG